MLQCLQFLTTRSRERFMPLIKSTSKEAFRKNVSVEGKTKPIKQAVAIAYNMKREAASEKRGTPEKKEKK